MDMSITLIVLIILLSIVIVICIKNIKEQNQIISRIRNVKNEELKNIFKENWDNEERRFNLKKANLLIQEEEIENKIAQLNVIFNEKENQYKAINQDLDFYRDGKIEEIDRAAAEYKEHRQLLIKKELEDYQKDWTDQFNNELAKIAKTREKALEELEKVEADLEVERSKRAAINEEVRRAREIEEKQDFYKIQINPKDLEDIELLRSVASRLQRPEAINKVIWSCYYQKPLAELRKRAGIEESGVYKITRLKTGEIYLGQAVNISTRWADHCKTALGIGTLASSQLHRVMAQDGPENFTFEVVEKVERAKLRERESFYIDFYDSKNYGLNTIRGEQNK